MAEKDFQAEFGRGLVGAGCHYYKIPDPPVSQMAKAGVGRFTERKPYDCYFIAQGLPFVACELKQQKTQSMSTGRETADLKPHQEEALLHVAALGQQAFVVVHFFFEPSKALAKKLGSSDVIDRAYAVHIRKVVTARTEAAMDSLPLDWWERNGIALQLYREKGARCWRPEPLIQHLTLSTPPRLVTLTGEQQDLFQEAM